VTEYKRHIKNKTHQRYISNYLENMKETEEFVSLIKQQRIEIGLLQQKLALLMKKPVTQPDLLFELD
jgi:hypothetical protein